MFPGRSHSRADAGRIPAASLNPGIKPASRAANFDNSRLALIQNNLRLAFYSMPFLAFLAGWLFLVWAPIEEVAAWAVWLMVGAMVAIALVRRFTVETVHPAQARRKLIISGLLMGFAILPWAALPILFWSAGGGGEIRYVILLLEAAAIPYTLVMASASWRVFIPYSLPFTAALILPALLQGGEVLMRIASLGIVYSLVMYGVAFQLHELITNLFRAREANTNLLEQVAHSKSESDLARMRAERVNQAKSTFLANMSHELRPPLNAVLGFSEVIKNEMLGPCGTPLYKEYANDIYASGKHLLGLINDILDLSRIEAGRIDLSPVDISLSELSGDACRLLARQISAANVEIRQDIAPGLALLRVDERAFRQILLNLVGNALKFTPRGGRITITGRMGSNIHGHAGVTIEVADTGIGIKKEDLPIVLEAFGQVRNEDNALTTPRQEGTGLGLPIVRGLVEAHGGLFMLESEIRKGTTAIIQLPSACVAPPDQGHFDKAVSA